VSNAEVDNDVSGRKFKHNLRECTMRAMMGVVNAEKKEKE